MAEEAQVVQKRAPAPPLQGLARTLVRHNLLSERDMRQVLAKASRRNRSLVDQLLGDSDIQAPALAQRITEEYNLPLYDLDEHRLESCSNKILSRELAEKHRLIPLAAHGDRLFVGMCDPHNQDAIKDIRFLTKLNVSVVVVEGNKLRSAIDAFYREGESIDDALGDYTEIDDLTEEPEETEDEDDNKSDEAPIVKYINGLLYRAISSGASDIHFEPYEHKYRVRMRVDGILKETASPPVSYANRLSARLKVMSRLDIAERRLPQDGRIKLRIRRSNRTVDFRVNTLPMTYGEKIVLRILDPASATMGIEALGYEDNQREFYERTLAKTQGMILVTGPTGSGKTVSLYTGLNILNTSERNISTAEDPVEINMVGINQVQINAKIGLSFAKALRAFLRQDPDVIMVGEIRDLETAEIAIKAAQTGHLVLSTLHTNSAPETLTRLLNMGVAAFNVAASVNLIIAQRLARRLCSQCKIRADIPEEILRQEGLFDCGIEHDQIQVHRAVGCSGCSGGYKGRLGIYEVMPVTPEISALILREGNSLQIAELAKKQGFHSLRQSAMRRVAQGIISLEEANRVTQE